MRNVKGFTLVELALAMAFVGVLSVSIVLIISNTVAAYQRGLTLTRVNSVGTDLSNDIRLSITNSSARDIAHNCEAEIFRSDTAEDAFQPLDSDDSLRCQENNAYYYTNVVKKKTVRFDDGQDREIPIFGAFCTGNYSYMWNSGYFISGNGVVGGQLLESESIKFSYLSNDGGERREYPFFKAIKVKDSGRAVCVAMRNINEHNRYDGNSVTNLVDISKIGNGRIEGGEPVELLPVDRGNNLALYDLFVSQPAVSTSDDNIFYSVSFVLGTTSGGADIVATGNSCAAPKDSGLGDSNYCAINKFNIAIQVNGGE